jgi:hypothetical protein
MRARALLAPGKIGFAERAEVFDLRLEAGAELGHRRLCVWSDRRLPSRQLRRPKLGVVTRRLDLPGEGVLIRREPRIQEALHVEVLGFGVDARRVKPLVDAAKCLDEDGNGCVVEAEHRHADDQLPRIVPQAAPSPIGGWAQGLGSTSPKAFQDFLCAREATDDVQHASPRGFELSQAGDGPPPEARGRRAAARRKPTSS